MKSVTRQCSKCGEYKTEDCFYENRQINTCKVCIRLCNRQWKERNREKYRAYMRADYIKKRDDPDFRKIMNARCKSYMQKNRRKLTEYNRTRPKEKVMARTYIHKLIRNGIVKRGSCLVCGEQNAQAHHEDYSKINEIAWLCHKHHRRVHSGEIKILPEQITRLP